MENETIHAVWETMKMDKGDLEERSIEYARLSIPSICPEDDRGNEEQIKSNVLIGPRLVNFLANKLTDVVFPHDRPFFKIDIDPETEFELSQKVDKEALDASRSMILETGMRVVRVAMSKLNMIQYRPKIIMAMKHLIVTGNVIVRRLPNGRRVEYGVKDMGIRRAIDGTPYDIILRDRVKFSALPPKAQDRVRQYKPRITDNTDVDLLARWHRPSQSGRWTYTEAVDEISLGTFAMISETDFPLLVLTWTLARGEHYGRGLVEDNIAAFNAIDVGTTALLDMLGIAADLKFLVNPGSILDLKELIESPRGSYHYGNENDITSPNVGTQKASEIQYTFTSVQAWERHLSAAFLMQSGTVRDAERVTAEEIKYYAREIESAFGGLYSLLSSEWQHAEAEWALRQVDKSLPKGFAVVVTSGLDALSSEAQLANLSYSLNDLAILNGIPEDIRGELSGERIARFIFTSRNLEYNQFTLTTQEKQARMQQQQAMMQQEQQAQVDGQVAAAAARQVG